MKFFDHFSFYKQFHHKFVMKNLFYIFLMFRTAIGQDYLEDDEQCKIRVLDCDVERRSSERRRSQIFQGKQGPRGHKGDQGLIGLPGPQGFVGLPGPQGETGPAGPQGLIGLPGQRGVEGPRGLQGENGVKGSQGMDGPPGESCNCSYMGELERKFNLTVEKNNHRYKRMERMLEKLQGENVELTRKLRQISSKFCYYLTNYLNLKIIKAFLKGICKILQI